MQPLCMHKISVQSSKPSHAYPIIRLPREFHEGPVHMQKSIKRAMKTVLLS
jgi:hypothetical protein